MDYDFAEYCDDHLSKTFNPFACELQSLVVSKVNRFNISGVLKYKGFHFCVFYV
jgi:hypothetical protein